MNKLENYKDIIETIFGKDSCLIDINKECKNNVVGGLNHDQFEIFTDHYKQRLERLAKIYSSADERNNLLNKLKEVANDRNWEGAYAEIVAYDFLNSSKMLCTPIKLEIEVNSSETLACNLGYKNINFDGKYEDFNVCFDVKTLSDKSGDILNNILKDVVKKANCKCRILPQYPLDIDYEILQKNHKNIGDELLNKLKKDKPQVINNKIVPELSFNVSWQGGALISESSYNPYCHAENHYKLLFQHTKKFTKNSPCLIVFVVFPWFSERIPPIDRANEKFYRSFARRFFCQYKHSPDKAQTILKRYTNETDTIFDITKKLSGILFIEDNSLSSKEDNGFAYLNPNAEHKVSDAFIDYLHKLPFLIDDFRYDNY